MNQRSFLKVLSFATLVLLPGRGFAASAPDDAGDQAGKELATELRALRPGEAVRMRGTIETRDAAGHRERRPIQFHTTLGTDNWSSIYEALTNEGKIAERLTVIRAPERANHYVFERLLQGRWETANLPGDQAARPFADSEFELTDLGLEFLNWPNQKLVKVKNPMRKGRSCQVLESRKENPGPNDYARVVSWIDRETRGIILAEAYDAQNRILKHFSVGSVTKVNDRMELKDMEIRNERTDRRTRLEFDYE